MSVVPNGKETNDFLTPAETARALRITADTVLTWVARRKIAHVKLGNRLLIPVSEVTRLLDENYTPARPIMRGNRSVPTSPEAPHHGANTANRSS